ncbi:MAG: MoxR family ATPase [Myxococcota bacterium]|nr:AAA family ATPase [Myxococcales bacterium]MEC7751314.1 MoxR family ATPase [Myxococcota bacterium]
MTTTSPLNEASLTELQTSMARLRDTVGRRVVGQDRVIEQLLVCLLGGGHGLFVGVPGLAKTLLVRSVAESLGLSFSRIQFTPDLMPADVLGSEVLEEDRDSGQRSFRFLQGPVFAQLLLADEINRTPPKTQSALLQAMQEKTVTVGGKDHGLPQPFHVFATQNPIEQEGTYPLPEAQLDRFMMQIRVAYPSAEEELAIAQLSHRELDEPLEAVLSTDELVAFQALVESVAVDENLVRQAVDLVRSSRAGQEAPDWVGEHIRWGAGPRASQFLLQACRARALLHGRAAADRDDLRALAPSVLGHRLVPSFRAESEGLSGEDLAKRLLEDQRD